MHHRKLYALWDIPNTYHGLGNNFAKFQIVHRSIELSLDRLTSARSRIVKIAYLTTNLYTPKLVRYLRKHGWKIRKSLPWKDIDTVITATIYDKIQEYTALVLISSDLDFIPPIRAIKRKRKPLYLFYQEGQASKRLIRSVHFPVMLPGLCMKCNGKHPRFAQASCPSCHGTGIFVPSDSHKRIRHRAKSGVYDIY